MYILFPLSDHFGAVFGKEQNARQKSDELLQNSKNFLSYLNQLMQEVQVPEKEPSFFPYVDSSELTELVRQSDVIIHARLLPESDAQKVKVAYNRLNYSFEILHCYRGHELLKTSEQGQKIAVYPGDAQPNKEYIFLLSFSGNYDSIIYQNSINSIQPLTKKKEIARIIAQQAAEKAETSQ